MARAYPDNLPSHYASDKLSAPAGIKSWWRGDIGRLTREYGARTFPGAPAEALMGFESNSGGPRENTTGWLTGSEEERAAAATAGRRPLSGSFNGFHELGLFGVEGGVASGPAPGQVAGPHNNWLPLATSGDVRNLLGRNAVTAPGSWVAVQDQIAIGLVNLRKAGREVMNGLPANIRARSEGSLWFVALAFMGWSAGVAGTRSHIIRYASALAGVPEASRWGAWRYWLAKDFVAGRIASRPANSHENPAYSAVRTQQKLRAGEELQYELGGTSRWFDDCIGTVQRAIVDDVLARAAVGQTVTSFVVPPSLLSCAPLYRQPKVWIGVGVGVALLSGVALATAYAVGAFDEPTPEPTR